MSEFALKALPPCETEHELPIVVSAEEPGISLSKASPDLVRLANEHLHKAGGILFRGFQVGGVDGFHAFADGFGHPLLSYEFGSTPRTNVKGGVYTSTEYPAHQEIPLHSEQAYTLSWPLKIWFYCITSAKTGGETPIADNRRIHQALSPSIRDRFARRGLRYVRNYGGGLDVEWQKVFNTDDRGQVERYCRQNDIAFEWKPGGELRTSQCCPAVMQHPRTNEPLWFNQAHLFHVSNLQPEVREALLDLVDEKDLPRNVYYGDGQPIEDAILDEVRAAMGRCKVIFPWQPGDILMLDNMLAAHGRSSFSGERKVVVAMAEAFSAPSCGPPIPVTTNAG